jgi:hypothetical protein
LSIDVARATIERGRQGRTSAQPAEGARIICSPAAHRSFPLWHRANSPGKYHLPTSVAVYPVLETKKKTVDCTQGVGDVLPYASSRDCPLRQPLRCGTVRAALDGLPPLRSTPQCYGSGGNEGNGSVPTTCEERACASVPSARRATQDRLKTSGSSESQSVLCCKPSCVLSPGVHRMPPPLFPLLAFHLVGGLLRTNDVMIMGLAWLLDYGHICYPKVVLVVLLHFVLLPRCGC